MPFKNMKNTNFLFFVFLFLPLLAMANIVPIYASLIGTDTTAIDTHSLVRVVPIAAMQDYFFKNFDSSYMLLELALGFFIQAYGHKIPVLQKITTVGLRVVVAFALFSSMIYLFGLKDVWYLISHSTFVMSFYDLFIKPVIRKREDKAREDLTNAILEEKLKLA
jgi:hypothetical protein